VSADFDQFLDMHKKIVTKGCSSATVRWSMWAWGYVKN
jgi:hypothetical protein